MIISERNYLAEKAAKGDYISIAMNKEGEAVPSCFVPWKHTNSAFNMKLPKVTLSEKDLMDDEILEDLRKCIVIGLYIFMPLQDYSFIAEFHKLRDLFICCGQNVKNLSFIQDMPGLFMFYLEDAKLPDLRNLIENCNNGEKLPGKCFGFYHCEIADTSALQDAEFSISELLFWPVGEDCFSKDFWR